MNVEKEARDLIEIAVNTINESGEIPPSLVIFREINGEISSAALDVEQYFAVPAKTPILKILCKHAVKRNPSAVALLLVYHLRTTEPDTTKKDWIRVEAIKKDSQALFFARLFKDGDRYSAGSVESDYEFESAYTGRPFSPLEGV